MLLGANGVTLTTEQVWEDFRSRLRGFLLRRVRDEALADDLLQETFIRVHRGLGAVRDPSRLLPWLSRVARSVVADHFRSELAGRGAVAETPERTGEQEATNYNNELGQCLSGMATSLPVPYRQAFKLVEVQGYKQREAASELSLSLSGAKSRIQRARKMLRESLLKCCEIEFDRRGNAIDYQVRSGCGHCSVVPLDAISSAASESP
jgi:RNA polymerase sigma-70 factor (ECF subfamily)